MAINYTDKLTPIESWKDLITERLSIDNIFGVKQRNQDPQNQIEDNAALYDIGSVISDAIAEKSNAIYDTKTLYNDLIYAKDNNGIYDINGVNVNLKGSDGKDGKEGDWIPYNILINPHSIDSSFSLGYVPNPMLLYSLIDRLGKNLVIYTWKLSDESYNVGDNDNFINTLENNYPSMYNDLKTYHDEYAGSEYSLNVFIYKWMHGSWSKIPNPPSYNIAVDSSFIFTASEGFFYKD